MNSLIENVAILRGEEFEFIKNGYIHVDDIGVIRYVGEARPDLAKVSTARLNGRGLIAIPGLVNAHIHIGDAIARDFGSGSTLRELVHPTVGLKSRLVKETPREKIREAISRTARQMLASGITTFADFREGGLDGVKLLKETPQICDQRTLILGRPNYYFSEDQVESNSDLPREVIDELEKTMQISDGLGISGPNEYTDVALRTVSKVASNADKLLAIHAAESEESTKFSLDHFGETEVQRAARLVKPDVMVHLTNSTSEDIESIAKNHTPVVCCARANSILGLGIPPIVEMIERGIIVALGTDNVMLNEPDMFREMDYASKALRATHRNPSIVTSKKILRMATCDAAKALGLGETTGSLEAEKRADIAFLNFNHANLSYSRDIVASIVHRATTENVSCVMVGGEVLHGSLQQT